MPFWSFYSTFAFGFFLLLPPLTFLVTIFLFLCIYGRFVKTHMPIIFPEPLHLIVSPMLHVPKLQFFFLRSANFEFGFNGRIRRSTNELCVFSRQQSRRKTAVISINFVEKAIGRFNLKRKRKKLQLKLKESKVQLGL